MSSSLAGSSAATRNEAPTAAVTFPSGDDVGALVVDLGSLTIQAGNAGDEWPRFFSESFVGIKNSKNVVNNFDCPNEAAAAANKEEGLMSFYPSNKSNSSSSRKRRYLNHEFPVSFSMMRKETDIQPCLYRSSAAAAPIGTYPSPSSAVAAAPFASAAVAAAAADSTYNLNDLLFSPSAAPLMLNKDSFETVMDKIFNISEGLLVEIKEKPILIAEPNVHNRSVREGMAEILFETFEAEGVYAGKKSVLSAFSIGRSAGLVVDVGAASTTITPVVDGYSLRKSVVEIPVGGNLVDYQLWHLLKSLGHSGKILPPFAVKKNVKLLPNLMTVVESVNKLHIDNSCRPSYYICGQQSSLRNLKESVCRLSEYPLGLTVPLNIQQIKHSTAAAAAVGGGGVLVENSKMELPDGTRLPAEQFSKIAPECLFNFNCIFGLPESARHLHHQHHQHSSTNSSASSAVNLPSCLLGSTSLTHAAAKTLLDCDVDNRRDFLQALVFTGGCSALPGFSERVSRQLLDEGLLGLGGLKYKVVCGNSAMERRFSAWIGGSILASLGTFQQMWMSRSEYKEHGASLMERRCVQ